MKITILQTYYEHITCDAYIPYSINTPIVITILNYDRDHFIWTLGLFTFKQRW